MGLGLLDSLGLSDPPDSDSPGHHDYFAKPLALCLQGTDSTAPVTETLLLTPKYVEKDSLGW